MAKSYLDNLQKELGQWKKAARNSVGKSGKSSGKSGQQSYKDALGQLGGAILGKQYSNKTGKRTK